MAQRRRNYRKLVWWGAGVFLILIIVIIVVGVMVNRDGQNGGKGNGNSEYGIGSVEQKENGEQNRKTESEKRDEEVARKQEVIQYEGEDPNLAEELTGVITYTGVADGVLVIRVSIDQYTTEGSCELTLRRGEAIIYSDTASVIGDVSTATCEGFDVSVGELGGGKVDIMINLDAGGKSGAIRGEVNI